MRLRIRHRGMPEGMNVLLDMSNLKSGIIVKTDEEKAKLICDFCNTTEDENTVIDIFIDTYKFDGEEDIETEEEIEEETEEEKKIRTDKEFFILVTGIFESLVKAIQEK